MLGTHFSSDQLIPLLLGSGILVISILYRKKTTLSLALLVLGALVLGYFAANLNHYLVIWDEQFHALVAKNMSLTPFTPMLYSDPVLEYDSSKWHSNHIWLHKQPLFLWQMALSIKMFGTNELAVRIPSILMHAIIPLFIYKIGTRTIRKEVGYIAAFIFTVSYFPLELIVGRFATDHNDVAFLFYVTGSFWAWFEYQHTKKTKYLILLAVFSGGATLVKWLMGLLVYVLWTLSGIITYRRGFFTKENLLPIIKAGLLTFIIFAPWQIYIHSQFPLESTHELAFNGRHFFEAIEGHQGNALFHFQEGLTKLYGGGFLVPIVLIISIVILIRSCKETLHRVFILGAILFVYLFFTLAATKMISFTLIVMPFVHLAIATLIYSVVNRIPERVKRVNVRVIVMPILLCLVGYFSLNLTDFQKLHTSWKPNENNNWEGKTLERKFIQTLNDELPNKQYVIFNTNTSLSANIPIMFYTNHIAYMEIPTQDQIEKMKSDGRNIAVLRMGELPEYILEDAAILKIEVPAELRSKD
jgi:4-amino-4-deoxy-L-arabinose transferase-like glycosyltransferase